MNLFGLSSLLTGLSSLGFGFLVLSESSNKKLSKIWSLFTFSVAMWGFCCVLISKSSNPLYALYAWRLAGIFGIVAITPLFYHFVCIFCELDRRKFVVFHYLVNLVWLFILPTKLFIANVRWVFNSFYYLVPGRLYFWYAVFYMVSILVSHLELIRVYKTATSLKRNQIKYFLTATVIGFSGGILFYLPVFGVDVYPAGNVAICLYPFIMSYAISKHQLMDINLIIRKTLIYSILTGMVAVLMVFVAMVSAHFAEYLFGHRWVILVLTACLITAIFHPLQLKIQVFVDRHVMSGWADREMVREVAAGFSHELKSPLAGLSMQVQQTLRTLEDIEDGEGSLREAIPKLKEELKYLLEKTIDAARRIDAVRGVAESTAGQLEPVDIYGVLESSLAALSVQLGQISAIVQRNLPQNLPLVRSNRKQLEIVLINLMRNALDAMGNYEARQIHALSLSGWEKISSVAISIKDTGPGIVSKDIDRIFEPYFTTKGHKGTGMGLYLSQQIIKAHGGTIEVKSNEGIGTEFIVNLPKYSVENGSGVAAA